MNQIDIFRAFSIWSRYNMPTANQRSLFYGLLEVWNDTRLVRSDEWLSVPNRTLETISGLSQKTCDNVKNQLQQQGILKIIPGKRNKDAAKYNISFWINVKKEEDFTVTPTVTVTPKLSSDVTVTSTAKLSSYTEKRKEEKSREDKKENIKENIKEKSSIDTSEQFSEYFKIFSDYTKGVKTQPRIDAMHEFADLHILQREEALVGARNYINWHRQSGEDIKFSKNASVFLKDLLFTEFQEMPVAPQQLAKKPAKSTKGLPEWGDEYKLIKAGVDTTGMTQNEMYKLAGEMGLHNG